MSKRIIVNSENGETRAAIVENGVLVDLFIERSLHPRYASNIYKGVVENVLPGMQAAFVNVGLERNVFLYVDDALAVRNGQGIRGSRAGDDDEPLPPKRSRSIKDILKTGQEIIVQVTKEPIGTKGARVVTDITLPGRYVVLMPTVDYVGVSRRIASEAERDRLRKIAQGNKPRKMGVIVRTVAEGRSEEEIAGDIQFLVKLWRRIQARARRAKAPAMLHKDYDLVFRLVRDHFSEDVEAFILDDVEEHKKVMGLMKMLPEHMAERVRLYTGSEPLFDVYGLEEEIARAIRRKVWLNCGGYLIIDHTEALTVIDVNTGKFTGSTCLADTVFRTNLEAAVEIARQLRLRNIGGIIVIDFIDMEDENHQKQVLAALEKALEGDKTKSTVLGFTQLGLVEMTRKKVQQGLVDAMMKVCPTCEGRGRTLSEETLAFRAMRAIKKEAMSMTDPAMLVLLHPSVAAMLIGAGGANLAALEKETGKHIYVKGSIDQNPEDIAIAATGTKEEVEGRALPVAVGDDLSLLIEEAHMTNSRDGIARVEGYVIDVEGAGGLVGKRVRARISKVFKTYAKAKLVLSGDWEALEAAAGDARGEAGATPAPLQPIKMLDAVSLSPVAPPPPARAKAPVTPGLGLAGAEAGVGAGAEAVAGARARARAGAGAGAGVGAVAGAGVVASVGTDDATACPTAVAVGSEAVEAQTRMPVVEAEMLLPAGRIREPLDNYDVVAAIEEVEGEDVTRASAGAKAQAASEKRAEAAAKAKAEQGAEAKAEGKAKKSRSRSRNGRRRKKAAAGAAATGGAVADSAGDAGSAVGAVGATGTPAQDQDKDKDQDQGQDQDHGDATGAGPTQEEGGVKAQARPEAEPQTAPATEGATAGEPIGNGASEGAAAVDEGGAAPALAEPPAPAKRSRSRRGRGGRGRSKAAKKAANETAATAEPQGGALALESVSDGASSADGGATAVMGTTTALETGTQAAIVPMAPAELVLQGADDPKEQDDSAAATRTVIEAAGVDVATGEAASRKADQKQPSSRRGRGRRGGRKSKTAKAAAQPQGQLQGQLQGQSQRKPPGQPHEQQGAQPANEPADEGANAETTPAQNAKPAGMSKSVKRRARRKAAKRARAAAEAAGAEAAVADGQSAVTDGESR